MAIFKDIAGHVIEAISDPTRFRNEQAMEDFFVKNLEVLLHVRFLKRQYPILNNTHRIDILGIDFDNSPVIIELKLDKGDDAVLQGQNYYNSWLLKSKPLFNSLVEIRFGKSAKVIWELPKVILIAKRFSPIAYGAVERNEYVELITYSCFQPDLVLLEGEELSTRLLHGKSETHKVEKKDIQVKQQSENYNVEQHLDIITVDEVRKKLGLC